MVFGDKVAYSYNPNNQVWSAEEAPNFQNNALISCYRKTFNSIFDLKADGKFTGWSITGTNKPMSHSLQFAFKNSKTQIIPVSLKLPEDFVKNTIIKFPVQTEESGPPKYREIPFSEYTKDSSLHVIALNQTESHFILGLQDGNIFSWQLPSRDGAMLPFVWLVPKEDILNALESTK